MTFDTANQKIRKEAARWTELLMDRDPTTAEREEFQRWLLTSELHQKEFRLYTSIMNLARDLPDDARTELLDVAMEDVADQGLRRKIWSFGIAASLIVMLSLGGWFGYRYDAASKPHITTAAATRDITLPDGSVAHLNTRTDLRWISHSSERRVVMREGEALFEVTHDPTRPFVVVLDASEIRVLGTRFNVHRRQSAEVVVTVLEGTVKVLGHSQPEWTRTLHANDQIVYNTQGLVRDVYAATGANAAKWREGSLEFDDEPLPNVIEDLGRYSDRPIVIHDPRLEHLHFGGQFDVHNNIRASLARLEKLAPLVTVHESHNTFVLDYQQEPAEETR